MAATEDEMAGAEDITVAEKGDVFAKGGESQPIFEGNREDGTLKQIFVELPQGKIITLSVHPDDTVKCLKSKIEEKKSIPVSDQYLRFETKPLEDNYTLKHYNVQKESTLSLSLRLRGGMDNGTTLALSTAGRKVRNDSGNKQGENRNSPVVSTPAVEHCTKRIFLVRHSIRADFTSLSQGMRWDRTWPDRAKSYEDKSVDVKFAQVQKDVNDTSYQPWRKNCCDAPLTNAGRVIASAVANQLPDDAEYRSSPFLRCRETVTKILEAKISDKPAIIDTSLTEHLNPEWFNKGVFEFMRKCHRPQEEDVKESLLKNYELAPENDRAYRNRACMVLNAIKNSKSKKDVVLVTHGGFVHNMLSIHAKAHNTTPLHCEKTIQYADVYTIEVSSNDPDYPILPLKAIVTGGAGFVGSHLCKALVKDGISVTVIDNEQRGSRLSVPSECTFIFADLLKPEACQRLIRNADVVFHLAACVGGVDAVSNIDKDCQMFKDTQKINLNVIDACNNPDNKIGRIIYASTACCYPLEKQNGDGTKLKEVDLFPANPESGYGWAKLMGEIYLWLTRKQLMYNIVRFHNLYGENMVYEGKSSQVVPALIRKAIMDDKGELRINGTGNEYRDFLYIDDAIAGLMAVLKSTNTDRDPLGIQFGSGEKTTINDLAETILEHFSTKKKVIPEPEKPKGDIGRYANIEKAQNKLGWKPQITLKAGIKNTVEDIKRRMEPVLAICLPITSRGVENPESDLKEVETGLPKSSRIYIGIDLDDSFYKDKSKEYFEKILDRPCHLTKFEPEKPAPIYRMYNNLAMLALKDKADFYVLWGDDIKVEHNIAGSCWLKKVVQKFKEYSENRGTPYGLGCVALNDTSSPGFPTFPVVHQSHIKLFGGFCPKDFINQDADPWVAQLYRRFGCFEFLKNVKITNEKGGTEAEPRYEKQHIDWKNELLSRSVTKVKQYYGSKIPDSCLTTTLDVVTPTHRINFEILNNIQKLKLPKNYSIMFIVIVDNPDISLKDKDRMRKLQWDYWPNVRVRFNEINLGASGSRNRGIEESAADWILFLDDDVDVSGTDLLIEYAKCIDKNGEKASGFVGKTIFPSPETPMQCGVKMSYITYFWTVADREMHPAWGVTANLVLRRTKARFHSDFIKTGGGEDIAICVDTERITGLPLLSAPGALALHPWWGENGVFSPWRFFNWTQGDGLLIDKYPNYTYYNFPNVIECTFFAVIIYQFLQGICSTSSTSCIKYIVWCWIIEIIMDIHHYAFIDVDVARKEGDNIIIRAYHSLYATWVKNHVELGHLWVQLKRYKMQNICKRFDWNCGKNSSAIQHEKRKAFTRFLFFVIVPCIYSYNTAFFSFCKDVTIAFVRLISVAI